MRTGYQRAAAGVVSCILVGGALSVAALHSKDSVPGPSGENPPVLLTAPQKMPDPGAIAGPDSRYLSLTARERYALTVGPSTRLKLIQYVVEEGDSLWSIAAASDTDTATLTGLNPRLDGDLLQPGQTLRVVPGFHGVSHTLEEGDTLADLADTYGTTVEQIRTANGLSSVSDGALQIGDTVFIPGARPVTRNLVVSRGDFVRPDPPANSSSAPAAPAARQAAAVARPAASGTAWRWPIVGGLITTEFTRAHSGLDIAVPSGTKAYAVRSGKVVFAGWDGGYGYCVILDHGDGIKTRYAHASSILVKVGQQVAQGDAVILVGSTGHSTGPHLHFEVIVDGVCLNPHNYLP